jgi:cell division protein FtsQ
MPAVMRGGNSRGKPAARKPAKPKAGPKAAYNPAKLKGVHGAGLKPQAALAAAGAVFAGGLVLMLATGGRAQALAETMRGGLDHRFAAAGFRVASLQIKGASPMARADIVRAAGLTSDQSILALDLEALRQRVETVGWIDEARVVRLLPDTVLIEVKERPHLAVWQHAGRVVVVDAAGAVIPEADPGRFPDLPLIVGEGANQAAAAVLPLIQSRPRLMGRLEALVRVDGRRWDLRLKDGGLIQLPAENEDGALIQLDQLDHRGRLLELGFSRVDLRDPQAVAVRPRDGTDGFLEAPAEAG